MTITSQPFVRFTSFNFWVTALDVLYQLTSFSRTIDPLQPSPCVHIWLNLTTQGESLLSVGLKQLLQNAVLNTSTHVCNIVWFFCRMQIQVTVAIDFTKSNGDPQNPSSLHHISSTHPNPYVKAIQSVVSILEYYDT